MNPASSAIISVPSELSASSILPLLIANKLMANQRPAGWSHPLELEADLDFWLSCPLALPPPDSSPCYYPPQINFDFEREDCDFEAFFALDSSGIASIDRSSVSETPSVIVDKKRCKAMGEIWKTTLTCPKSDSNPAETHYTTSARGRDLNAPHEVSELACPPIRKITDMGNEPVSPALISTNCDAASSTAPSQPLGKIASQKPTNTGKKKGKAGKKPVPCVCFLCDEVLPYRIRLIEHLKKVHGIERSQSLMYKRLNQGEEEIKRLYMKYRKNYRLEKR